jgi:hypothetical protein
MDRFGQGAVQFGSMPVNGGGISSLKGLAQVGQFLLHKSQYCFQGSL